MPLKFFLVPIHDIFRRFPESPGTPRVTPSCDLFVPIGTHGYGARIPMSTEILESTFGLYKLLEGQQSKSGFTWNVGWSWGEPGLRDTPH